MLNKGLKEKVYCGLDIGAQNIKVSLIQSKDSGLEVLGAYGYPIYGFKSSSVSDFNEFSECVHHVLNELAEKTGIRVKSVQLGLDGNFIDVRKTSTAIPLIDKGNKVITDADIRKVNKQARLLGVRMEDQVLHEKPQVYHVDDVNSAINPVGLYGRKLAVESLILVSNVDRVKNILKSVNHAGYDISQLYFGSYVASDLVLTEENRKKGCVLIDTGADVTSVLIFHEGRLKNIETLKIGGNHFTQEIARVLNLSFELAEEIKKSYATAIISQIQEDEEILVKRETSYIPIKRIQIYNAILKQVDGLVEEIHQIILRSGLYAELYTGIRMIGGGSLLTGLIERIEEKTKLTVALAQINNISQRNISNSALFSTAVALAQKGYEDSMERSIIRNDRLNFQQKLMNKAKELYEEYF
ncbi:MAG: cell division protein FtsA [Candidatus Omnitrophica bacterium]|nr:cell division protein FtsA [Candidatus Omnitrophota bacterium]